MEREKWRWKCFYAEPLIPRRPVTAAGRGAGTPQLRSGSCRVTLLPTLPRPQPLTLLRAHVQQPIAIEVRRCRTPRVCQFFRHEGSWELFEQLFAPIRQGPLTQVRQGAGGVAVEVALRH